MLDIAIKYQEKLKEMMLDTWFKDKYKYWNYHADYCEFNIDSDTWRSHSFVSIDNNGNIIGYISYEIDRRNNQCQGLNIINFSNKKIIFGKDVKQAITDIFERYNFRKLNFTVVVGNPIEHTYDRLIKKYGGRIVGYKKEHTKLIDGKYYDVKCYEIMREDYIVR